ncbi:UNVERIFIED_CONTAM: putative tetraacyldisaccharide 4'-kinase, mitochondrial [Sesamum radiatum]|uniref:tetraacyldisaccharide 4'-kinase n=1 Tax=Sesamum radiatum TaxID=300843 RepID=A0AAW2LRJ8_SESRA
MEQVRRAVKQIACTPPSQRLSTLSAFQLSLIPLLSIVSSLYSVALRLRRHLYRFNLLQKHRLPVPVISVGNLTWGGNGKTPMVEFLARCFADDGISPLILTRVQINDIDALESAIRKVKVSLPIFFTKMAPMHFLPCRDVSCKLSLKAVDNMTVLCLSGIGFADSFIRTIERMGAAYVDHLDFSDHHIFQLKDYDRAPEVLEDVKPYEVLVLCSRLQFLVHKGRTEDSFKKVMREHLRHRSGVNLSLV